MPEKIPPTGREMTRRQALRLFAAGSLLTCLAAAPAETVVAVSPHVSQGIWQGWGCSLAWWANVFGDRSDLADLLFTARWTTLSNQSLPGLGLTVARYNAGGCTESVAGGARMQASPRIPACKQIQGFWLNDASADPASASWNWSVDANQRLMLRQAQGRGASRFELFSNSPLWWMCRNHNPSGADKGGDNNLLPSDLRRHAVYLAAVTRHAADHWGIPFGAVEAFNESSADWWNSRGTQEGCHFDAATQAVVIGALREELDARGLKTVKVAASDENTYDEAARIWRLLGTAANAQVGRVNVHGYQYGGGRRDLLRRAVGPTELWNSEYGENDASGLSLAANLSLDLRWLKPSAWCYWQPLDGGGWGLIQSDLSRRTIGAVNPKYFVLAQYSRHVRPGMVILETADDSTVAAWDRAGQTLALVTVNGAAGRWQTYDLTSFPASLSLVTRWVTEPRPGGERYAAHHDIRVRGGKLRAWLAPNSVQTFEVQFRL